MVQKITPNLWCNGNAEEMVDFYRNAFTDFEVLHTENYPESRDEGLADFQQDLAGKVLTIQFRVHDLEFVAINAGPEFTPNPSISFFVNFDPSRGQTQEQLDELWGKLSDDGTVLMELGEYPFSPHYGWIQDKFGVSWQLILTNPDGEPRPTIVPSLLFTDKSQNQAHYAAELYVSLFDDAAVGNMSTYGQDMGPAKADSIAYGDFRIGEQWLAVMDNGGVEHKFNFTEGVSLSVACKDQAEIDKLWGILSTVPEAEQCGWCKDKFGVSWQIVPANIDELMQRPGAFKTMMQQHKIVIAEY
ncbi:VOC family protein [Candidatus Mycosynbacter amalyticus]|uniref:VOC family protein n=1 Tax=Candidatus Mycosynbacter amalyticus TaxID=2665156 RepID=A0A857MUG2_9BACT|nr:VOC family protein [Candidatus Mycosynbacter amalyticus]QHN43037.1 VOC family protein [Candidatus Mycosynbacter amalyticus]